jgi:hypothetical protein
VLNRIALAAVGAASLTVALAPSAAAEEAPRWSRTLTDQVGAPFGIAVHKDQVYVADGATATVSRIKGDGSLATIATASPSGDVAGIDLNADGTSLAYTATDFAAGTATLTIKTEGKPDVVADLRAHEENKNPDGKVTYGLRPGASQCAKDFAEAATQLPATYTGIVDAHPYAVASLGDGSWVVADAGANALLKVNGNGRVSTLAVLPAQRLTFTADMAAAIGAPDCIVGETYRFEAVPTDVEVGPDGKLWVTTLPGGPEDPSLGARGALYSVTMSGRSTRVASGFLGATNVAVAPNGSAYVTELFAGKISKVGQNGNVSDWASLPGALAVEVKGEHVYAATIGDMASGAPGTVVKFNRD